MIHLKYFLSILTVWILVNLEGLMVCDMSLEEDIQSQSIWEKK